MRADAAAVIAAIRAQPWAIIPAYLEAIEAIAARMDDTWDFTRVKFVAKNNPGDLLLSMLERAAALPDDDGENLMAVMKTILSAAEEEMRPDFVLAAARGFIQIPVPA